MKHSIRKLLYRSYDKALSPDEEQNLQQALDRSEEMRNEAEELEQVRELIKSAGDVQFKPLMAERVMSRLTQSTVPTPADEFFESLNRFFKPLGIAATLVLFGLLAYNISSTGYFSIDTLIGLPELTVDNLILAFQ